MLTPKNLTITKEFVTQRIGAVPQLGIILGSGLEEVAGLLKNPKIIPYASIPYFVRPTIPGHPGKIVFGDFADKKILILQGRPHYYEGYSLEQTTYPVRLLSALGIKTLLTTGAAGAVKNHLKLGDLVLLKDHLNLFAENPLRGSQNWDKNIFLDLSQLYSLRLRKLLLSISKKLGMIVHQGVYAFMPGPTYETGAELGVIRKTGADVVAMSIVPENIVAYQEGMEVSSLVYVANRTGITKYKTTHEDVLRAGKEAGKKFIKILQELIKSAKF
ncbi:MAG: purine-nucleoside phosphorylase [Elusimicrobiota bacterium]